MRHYCFDDDDRLNWVKETIEADKIAGSRNHAILEFRLGTGFGFRNRSDRSIDARLGSTVGLSGRRRRTAIGRPRRECFHEQRLHNPKPLVLYGLAK
jgi:hypothetical protein